MKIPAAGRVEVFDALVPGFGMRITAKGRKSFFVMYRIDKKLRRLTIGPVEVIGLDEARDIAKDALLKARKGQDAAAERKSVEKARAALDLSTIAERFKREYIDTAHRNAPKSKRIFDRYVSPAWNGRTVDTIGRADVKALILSVNDQHGLYMANRVLAIVRRFLNWCEDEEIIREAPSFRGVALKGEKRRERVLRNDELRAIWEAAEGMGNPFGSLFKILLLTGQRREEVAGMRWSEIERNLWTIPTDRTKAERSHQVPLSPMALDILAGIPKVSRQDHVFASGRAGDTAVSGFSRAKVRLDKAIAEAAEGQGLPDWRIHDIRRTVATKLRELGVERVTVSRILNHAEGGVTSIYDRHSYLEEKRAALNTWAHKVAAIMEKNP